MVKMNKNYSIAVPSVYTMFEAVDGWSSTPSQLY
jgi:hypothetical protein